jgi:hypothetical protein
MLDVLPLADQPHAGDPSAMVGALPVHIDPTTVELLAQDLGPLHGLARYRPVLGSGGQQAFEEAVAIGRQFTAEGLAPVLLDSCIVITPSAVTRASTLPII